MGTGDLHKCIYTPIVDVLSTRFVSGTFTYDRKPRFIDDLSKPLQERRDALLARLLEDVR